VDIWDRELGVHAKGVFLGTRYGDPGHAQRRWRVDHQFTSSVMGIVGPQSDLTGLFGRQGAITIFTKSAALQYAKENIRINSVHPGYADTPLTVKRFNDPACARSCSIARRWGGSAPPRISPMACSSWRPTNHPGSPARNW